MNGLTWNWAKDQEQRYMEHRPSKDAKLVIGNDVWMGANVVLLGNLKIGNGAVIGANSVVTHDVKPYSIVAGTPAKLIRYRFDEKTRNALSKIHWWTWNESKLSKALPDFYDPNKFVKKYLH